MNEEINEKKKWKQVEASSGWTLDIENTEWYELSEGCQKYIELAANHSLPSLDENGSSTPTYWAIRASARSTAGALLSFIYERKGLTIDDELCEEMRLLCCKVADD